jgi:hypothetical protein
MAEDAPEVAPVEENIEQENIVARQTDTEGVMEKWQDPKVAAARSGKIDVVENQDAEKQAVEPVTIEGELASRFTEPPKKEKKKRGIRVKSSKPFKKPSLVAALVLVGFVLIALLVPMRKSVVAAVPDLASFYALAGLDINLKGLDFKDIKTYQEKVDGFPVLVVEGAIHNITDDPIAPPVIRLSLLSDKRQEMYVWTVDVTQIIAPGEEARFTTRVTSPPPEAKDLRLRFVDPKAQERARVG